VIPWATFTEPEVARVGLNEQEAKEKNVAHTVTVYGIDDLDRAIADGEAHGFVKVLTAPGTDRILGVTIVGEHAGDLLAEYVLAMKHGLGLNKILGTIHTYPTLAEANKYAAGAWKRSTVTQGQWAFLAAFQAWQRGEHGLGKVIGQVRCAADRQAQGLRRRRTLTPFVAPAPGARRGAGSFGGPRSRGRGGCRASSTGSERPIGSSRGHRHRRRRGRTGDRPRAGAGRP
jgi:hypothetical protein